MNTVVKGTMDNDTGYATKGKIKQCNKYKRKHENESVTEKIEQRTDKEEQKVNSVVRDKQGNVIPPCSGDVTQESVSPRKKAKKQKHLNDLITADIVKTKDQEREIVAHVEDRTDSDVPASCGDMTEGSNSEKERRKEHKHKYQKNLVPEKMEVETDGKQEKVNHDVKEKSGSVLTSTSRNVIKESRKTNKQSYQSDLMIKNIVKSILSSSGVITKVASSFKNTEKTKKRKHKHKHKPKHRKDIECDKTKVIAEIKREIHPDVKEKSETLIPPTMSDVTEGSGSLKKKIKARKQEHKNKQDSMSEKMRDETERKEKEVKADVHKQSGSGIFVSNGDDGEESVSWSLVISDLVKTKGQEKKVSADVNDKKCSSGIREISDNREKKKKAKNHKHRQKKDFMFEEMQVEPESKEVHQDVKEKSDIVLSSRSDLTKKSRGRQKKDQTKNHKQPSDLIVEDAVETKGQQKEGVKNIKQKNIFPSSGDVTEKSSFHEKTKKARKHKHKPERYSLNKEIQEGTKGKEKDVTKNVKYETDNVIRPGRKDVMKELHNRERKGENTEKDKNTKVQKKQSHLKIEDTVKTKGQEKERNAHAKDKKENVMLPIGSNIPEQQAKKGKHEHTCKKTKDETEGKEKEVNKTRKEKLDSVIFLGSSDVTEESRNRQKKQSTAKQKHQSDLILVDNEKTKGEKMNINAVLKEKKGTDIPPSHGGITKDSGDRKKTKKKKDKHRHKKHSIVEIGEETEDKEKEVNKDAKDNSDNLISASTADVTVESVSDRESKKSKKRKYESYNVTGKSEVIGKHVNTGVIDASRNAIRPRSGVITEVLDSDEEKRKQSKKRRYENEIVTEKTKGKGSELNAGFKDEAGKVISPSNGYGEEESGSCEKKKARKRRSEVHKVSGKTDKEEEVNVAETGNNMPSNSGVTTELGCSKERKQWKKRNCESNPVTENSGSWKEVNAYVKDYLEGGMAFDTAQERANSTNNAISTQVITKTTEIIDVGDIAEKKELCKTSEVMSKPNKRDEKKEIGGRTRNQWETADFDSVERKEKFLRLMGALKPSTRQRETSKYSALAMNKKQEEGFVSSLEKHYFQALHTGKEKGVGLGYK